MTQSVLGGRGSCERKRAIQMLWWQSRNSVHVCMIETSVLSMGVSACTQFHNKRDGLRKLFVHSALAERVLAAGWTNSQLSSCTEPQLCDDAGTCVGKQRCLHASLATQWSLKAFTSSRSGGMINFVSAISFLASSQLGWR